MFVSLYTQGTIFSNDLFAGAWLPFLPIMAVFSLGDWPRNSAVFKKKKAHHFKKHYSAKKPKLKRKKHSTIPCKCIDQTNSAWKNKCKSKRNSKFWKRMTALLNEIKGHKLCDTHEKLLAERLGFKTGNFTKLKIRIKNFQQIQTSYRILSTTLTDSCRSQWRKKLNKKINLWKE